MKKVYLKVELGSRGEIDDVCLIKGSWNDILEDLENYIKEIEEDDEDYIEEFFGLNGRFGNDEKDDVLVEDLGEENCNYYIEYDKYEDDCKELRKLFKEGKVNEFCDLMEKFW